MRIAGELLRILVIIALLGGLGKMALEEVYSAFGFLLAGSRSSWLAYAGILLLLLVLYRNKLQFAGWYKGEGRRTFSKPVTIGLIFGATLLFLLTPLLG